jgi:hypothetical protein
MGVLISINQDFFPNMWREFFQPLKFSIVVQNEPDRIGISFFVIVKLRWNI